MKGSPHSVEEKSAKKGNGESDGMKVLEQVIPVWTAEVSPQLYIYTHTHTHIDPGENCEEILIYKTQGALAPPPKKLFKSPLTTLSLMNVVDSFC